MSNHPPSLVFQFLLTELAKIQYILNENTDKAHKLRSLWGDQRPMFCWNCKMGSLPKLRKHSLDISHNLAILTDPLLPLSLACMQTGKGWRAWNAQFKDYAQEVPEYLFREENLIYYLIRHFKTFEKIFGRRTLKGKLDKLFPGGLEELSCYLLERYQARGFDKLLPKIPIYLENIK